MDSDPVGLSKWSAAVHPMVRSKKRYGAYAPGAVPVVVESGSPANATTAALSLEPMCSGPI